jgi:hypothetical protein
MWHRVVWHEFTSIAENVGKLYQTTRCHIPHIIYHRDNFMPCLTCFLVISLLFTILKHRYILWVKLNFFSKFKKQSKHLHPAAVVLVKMQNVTGFMWLNAGISAGWNIYCEMGRTVNKYNTLIATPDAGGYLKDLEIDGWYEREYNGVEVTQLAQSGVNWQDLKKR